MTFKHFEPSDYSLVIDFLVKLNKENPNHINWNWARFERMYFHPEFDKSLINSIGLWLDNGDIVAIATFDMYFGESACLCLEEYEYLYEEVVNYAKENMNENGEFALTIEDNNAYELETIKKLGYTKIEQDETLLCASLENIHISRLNNDFSFVELDQIKDNIELQWLFYQGFDHGDDKEEFNKQLDLNFIPRPHCNKYLSVGIRNAEGKLISFCGCWYLEGTDYAYIEPACTIPAYRNKGIGTEVLLEVLRRAKTLGAKKAYVISDNNFYKKCAFC